MITLNGKKIAEKYFLALPGKDLSNLSLSVVMTDNNPLSALYVKNKQRTLSKYGITVNTYFLSQDIEKEIVKLKEDGIIIQLPVSSEVNKERVISSIPPEKDVDVFSKERLGEYYLNKPTVVPPVVIAIETIVKEIGVNLKGKEVVLVGGGELVGKPLSLFFLQKEATVTVVNKSTKDLSFFTKRADLIVTGAGVPGLITGELLKEGVILIDAGTSIVGTQLEGDVNKEEIENKPEFFVPVPNGVGPLTIYGIARNLLKLKEMQNE